MKENWAPGTRDLRIQLEREWGTRTMRAAAGFEPPLPMKGTKPSTYRLMCTGKDLRARVVHGVHSVHGVLKDEYQMRIRRIRRLGRLIERVSEDQTQTSARL